MLKNIVKKKATIKISFKKLSKHKDRCAVFIKQKVTKPDEIYTFSPPSTPPSSTFAPVTAAKSIFAIAKTLLSFVS